MLARRHRASSATIRARLVARGVEIRPKAKGKGARVELPVDELIAAYRAGIGMKVLARKYDVANGTIRDRLVKAGVEIRRQGDRSTMLPDTAIAASYQTGASLRALGREHGVNESTIANHLRAHGHELRPGGGDRFGHLDWAAIAAEYRAGASTETLAARYGTSPQTMIRRLPHHGAPIRPQGAKPNGMPHTVDLPTRELKLRYELGWSLKDLADHYRCSEPTIRARLVDEGVTIRPAHRPLKARRR